MKNRRKTFRVVSLLVVLLRIAWGVVIAAMVGLACLFAVSVFGDLSGAQLSLPVSFHTDAQTLRVIAPGAISGPARLDAVMGHANLAFVPPSRLFVAATGISIIVALALALWLLRQLLAVFESVRRGKPFVASNAGRIRHMAYVIIGAEGVRAIFEFIWNRFALTHFAMEGWRFDSRPDVHLTPLLAGLVVLALSEVFRAGAQLDEDQSLTV